MTSRLCRWGSRATDSQQPHRGAALKGSSDSNPPPPLKKKRFKATAGKGKGRTTYLKLSGVVCCAEVPHFITDDAYTLLPGGNQGVNPVQDA